MTAVSLPKPLVPIILVRRANRFAAEALTPGRQVYLHLPNSGRMEELLRPGTSGLAYLRSSPAGRTNGTLLLVRHHRQWVGLDARLPNDLFEAAVRDGALAPFKTYRRWQREVVVGGCRIDFILQRHGSACLVETKSCNRVDAGVALFPDAPTARGARHLRALVQAAGHGRRAAVVWFVQRPDARVLRPFAEVDPHFARAVSRAALAGVEFYAYICRVTPAAVHILRPIPVQIDL